MQYPKIFEPDGIEPIKLDSNKIVNVRKAKPNFRRWAGQRVVDSYGHKPGLDVAGSPAFAEILILRQFQQHGWNGVWVDTFRRKFRTPQTEVFEQIRRAANSRGGCFLLEGCRMCLDRSEIAPLDRGFLVSTHRLPLLSSAPRSFPSTKYSQSGDYFKFSGE